VRAAACYGIEVIAAAAAVALEGHGHRVAAARLAFRPAWCTLGSAACARGPSSCAAMPWAS